MLISLLIFLLVSNAVTLGQDRYILFSRVVIKSLLFACLSIHGVNTYGWIGEAIHPMSTSRISNPMIVDRVWWTATSQIYNITPGNSPIQTNMGNKVLIVKSTLPVNGCIVTAVNDILN